MKDARVQPPALHRKLTVVSILTSHHSLLAYILRILIIISTLFFMALTFLYSYAQLMELDVSNLWCNNVYSLNEIRQHSEQNNLPLGDSESCYIISDAPTLNYQSLNSVNGIYGSSQNITGFLAFFEFMVTYGTCVCVV